MRNGLGYHMRLIEQESPQGRKPVEEATSWLPTPAATSAINGKRPQSCAAAITGVTATDVARIAWLKRAAGMMTPVFPEIAAMYLVEGGLAGAYRLV